MFTRDTPWLQYKNVPLVAVERDVFVHAERRVGYRHARSAISGLELDEARGGAAGPQTGTGPAGEFL